MIYIRTNEFIKKMKETSWLERIQDNKIRIFNIHNYWCNIDYMIEVHIDDMYDYVGYIINVNGEDGKLLYKLIG